MSLKRTLLIAWVFLWIAEPFLALAKPAPPVKTDVCASCGMKDKCGAVCCCVTPHPAASSPSHHDPGLYGSSCAPGDAANTFFGEDSPKWFSGSAPRLFRSSSLRDLTTLPAFAPLPSLEVVSPPPELDISA